MSSTEGSPAHDRAEEDDPATSAGDSPADAVDKTRPERSQRRGGLARFLREAASLAATIAVEDLGEAVLDGETPILTIARIGVRVVLLLRQMRKD